MRRREFLGALLGGAAAPSMLSPLPAHAQVQSWPAKPVKIVVAFAPGGAADLFARMLSAEMSKTFRQQF